MNKDEIALDYKKELKKRISSDYERRVKQWMAADPSQLIDAAEERLALEAHLKQEFGDNLQFDKAYGKPKGPHAGGGSRKAGGAQGKRGGQQGGARTKGAAKKGNSKKGNSRG